MPVTSPAVRRLIVSSAVSAVGTGLVLPLTLIYLHRVRGIPLGTTGLLLAIPGVVGLVAVPVAGTLMDRIGARRVLAMALALQAAAQLALAFTRTAEWAAPVMFVQGLANGPLFPAFNTLLGGLAAGGAQQRAFAVNFTVLNAGIGVGGLIGGVVVDVHHPATFQLMFIGNAVVTLAAAGLVRSVPVPPVQPRAAADDTPVGYRQVISDPLLRRVVLLALLLALTGYAALDSGLPAYANVVADVPAGVIALSLSANTLMIVLAQLPMLRLLRRRRRSHALAAVGLVWCGSWLLFGTSALPDAAWMRAAIVLAFSALFGLGETLMAPSFAPLVNSLAPEEVRGRANALTSGMYSVAFVVSPAISAGFVAAGLGGLWIILLAAGCLTVTAWSLRLRRALTREQDVGQPAVPAEPAPELV